MKACECRRSLENWGKALASARVACAALGKQYPTYGLGLWIIKITFLGLHLGLRPQLDWMLVWKLRYPGESDLSFNSSFKNEGQRVQLVKKNRTPRRVNSDFRLRQERRSIQSGFLPALMFRSQNIFLSHFSKIQYLKAFVPEATEDRWTSQATSDSASFSGAKLYGNVSYKGVR
nr:PREDICTED: uncharacterized protein LOC104323219 isoform X2 [Haliaeetus albicilla]